MASSQLYSTAMWVMNNNIEDFKDNSSFIGMGNEWLLDGNLAMTWQIRSCYSFPTSMFALFSENQRSGGIDQVEKYWGIYYPNNTSVSA